MEPSLASSVAKCQSSVAKCGQVVLRAPWLPALQWLVRFSPHELAKALRAQWEAEQPVHAAPWVKLVRAPALERHTVTHVRVEESAMGLAGAQESELQLRKSRPDSGNTMHVFRACAVAPHAQQAAMQDMAAFRPPQVRASPIVLCRTCDCARALARVPYALRGIRCARLLRSGPAELPKQRQMQRT